MKKLPKKHERILIKLKQRLLSKHFTEEEADELLKERHRLQWKTLRADGTPDNEFSNDVKRLNTINHLIFGEDERR